MGFMLKVVIFDSLEHAALIVQKALAHAEKRLRLEICDVVTFETLIVWYILYFIFISYIYYITTIYILI